MRDRYCIAVYIRLSMEDLNLLSSSDKYESFSISNQRSFIQNYIDNKEEFHGAIIKEYIDDGYSGTNFDRPGVKAMLDACKLGEIDCVIVKDLSRFGRNYIEVGDYLEQIFPFLGVRFIGINDGFDSKNFLGQTSGMDVAFKNFIYEMYSRDLSDKVKSGVSTCMKRGEYHAGCMMYGYCKSADGKNMVIDEDAAVVIRRIFQELADGKKANNLAKEFNEEGIPTRLAYKQSKGEQLNRHYEADIWTGHNIRAIVQNEVYQGDRVYRKSIRTQMGKNNKVKQPREKWLIIPNHHEAIVSRELFARANENIRKGKIPEYDRSNVKRGIVVCGCCGRRLELHKTKNAYYVCKRRKVISNVPCNYLRIEKATIENLILKIWIEHCRYFQKTSIVDLLVERLEELQKKENNLDRILNLLPTEKVKLYERFREENMDRSEFLKEKNLLTQKELEVKNEITALQEQMEYFRTRIRNSEGIMEFVKKYCELDQVTDSFISELVEKVVVYEDNRVEVVWKYRDEIEMTI